MGEGVSKVVGVREGGEDGGGDGHGHGHGDAGVEVFEMGSVEAGGLLVAVA